VSAFEPELPRREPIAGLALEAILANAELSRRPVRRIAAEHERHAFDNLARSLATSPRGILQKVSDTAMALCDAQSAGISLLEHIDERPIFRWHAVSGEFASYLWGTMPRSFSPCGTVLDRDAAQLMVEPERYFTPLLEIRPKIVEALLVPFRMLGETAGTVWILAHRENRRFDAEDCRIVRRLARFAGTAYERLSSLSADDVMRLSSSRGETTRAAAEKRILVVDDNVDGAASLALILRNMGHAVTLAHTGRSALELCRSVRPQVIFLDIVLPDMEGHEVAWRLREEHGSSLQIIALTGFAGSDYRERSVQAGFNHHLVKPVDPEFLRSLLG
jgi:CheY-like chemotaxis protein